MSTDSRYWQPVLSQEEAMLSFEAEGTDFSGEGATKTHLELRAMLLVVNIFYGIQNSQQLGRFWIFASLLGWIFRHTMPCQRVIPRPQWLTPYVKTTSKTAVS